MKSTSAMKRNTRRSVLPWSRADMPALALVGLGTTVAIWRFWQPGISSAADMLMGIYRVFELDQSWRAGLFYPRLGMDLNFTYGAPLFQFYPPLVSYGTLVFHWAGLGWIEATKAMFTLTLLLAGVGMYLYARWLYANRRAAVVSAVAYLFAPYLLTNVYERGAAAETLALALLPWVFWAFHHLLYEKTWLRLWIAAALLSLLILAHNITALFALPLLVIYLTFLAMCGLKLEKPWKQLLTIGLAIIIGLALSAFYWLPALAEVGYTQIESTMLTGATKTEENLTSLGELIQPWLAFDYWGPLRFRLALWQALLGGVAMVGLVIQPKKLRLPLALLAGATVILLLLQLTVSKPFWQIVPLVRFVQFPWRLLGFAAFGIALLAGSLLCLKQLAGRGGWLAAIALVILILSASTRNLSPNLSSIWYDFSSSQVSRRDMFERGRFDISLFSDYLPLWAGKDSLDFIKPRPADDPILSPLTAAPALQVIEEGATRLTLQVRANHPFTIRLHKLFFPGWQVYVGGKPVPTGPTGSLGLVTADLPAGDYPVVIRFEETPVRQAANALSVLATFVGVIGTAIRWKGRHMLPIGGALLTLVVMLALQYYRTGEALRSPVAYAANLQDEIHLLGYHLPQRTWQAGDTLTLRLYWMTQKTPADNYKVFLHLAKLDDSVIVAQGDGEPILGYSPTTRWEPGELVIDEQQIYLDETIPPGTYQLLLGMYQPEIAKNLQVRQSPHTLSGDRIVLTQIKVGGK